MGSDFGIIEMDFVVLVFIKWIWNMEKSHKLKILWSESVLESVGSVNEHIFALIEQINFTWRAFIKH